ncbi:MAG: response regulator [Desulfobulbaceae bacterium]|nr:response regulator [Desulfobulbaceae bacterium]
MDCEQYRIMVVDDEPAIAEGIATTLAVLTGYACDAFSNPLVALESFKKRPYNLVLTDLTMPGLGGFDLVAQINEIHSSTDAIIITAHKSPYIVHNSHLLGAVDIFYKPLNIEELENRVQYCHQKFLTWKNRFREVTFVNH